MFYHRFLIQQRIYCSTRINECATAFRFIDLCAGLSVCASFQDDMYWIDWRQRLTGGCPFHLVSNIHQRVHFHFNVLSFGFDWMQVAIPIYTDTLPQQSKGDTQFVIGIAAKPAYRFDLLK